MIQAIGLTSAPRRGQPPVVDDLTFEVRPGQVTALFGPRGAGKTSALRLLLRLDPGRGVALFRGAPLPSVPCPEREVGVLLGDVPGHPDRSARGHLRMLAAAAGVPPERADALLDVVGLSGLAGHRLGSFSLGMDRRLGVAAALLGDPHTLVLDEPVRGLSPREARWLQGLLDGYAKQGGAVLTTTRDAREATRIADRVIAIEGGRLVADQDAADFGRARMRPFVAVSSPHAERLATLLAQEARVAHLPAGAQTGLDSPGEAAEVVREGGTSLRVYGSSCAVVGEIAHRNGILVHRLADDTGVREDPVPLQRADGRPFDAGYARVVDGSTDHVEEHAEVHAGDRCSGPPPRGPATGFPSGGDSSGGDSSGSDPSGALASPGTELPCWPAMAPPGPGAPLRYELRRWGGVRGTWYTCVAALAAALLLGLALAATVADRGPEALLRMLTGQPSALPLSPAAVAAGLLGALAFGQEFRYPALAPAGAPVPRRIGLLTAKLLVSGVAALALCLLTAVLNGFALCLLLGPGVFTDPTASGLALRGAGQLALVLACAWSGLLAAAAARATAVGLAAVLAVPLLAVPLLRGLLTAVGDVSFPGFSGRLETAVLASWPSGAERWMAGLLRLLSQPAGQALAVVLLVLAGTYTVLSLRGRARARVR